MAGPSLIATLGANISGFVRDLETAKGQARSHGEGIGSAFGDGIMGKLAAFGEAAAIEETFRRTFEWAEKLANLSSRTGLGTTELQKLEGIAAKTGTSVESLAGFYERLGKAMAGAHKEGPGGDTSGALGRLGVSDEALASGNMQAAMQEVADHFQRVGEITPQVEADLAKIFKNAREVIPALKGMTTEEELFNQTVAVSEEKMEAMKTVMDTIKDGWRMVSGLVKNVVGSLAEGAVEAAKIAKWTGLGLIAPLFGKSPSEAYAQMREEEEARKKRVEELKGQKPGSPGYAKSKADQAEEKEAAKRAGQQQAHDEKELAMLRQKTAEEKERGHMAAMTTKQRAAALQQEVELLKSHVSFGKSSDESAVQFAEKQLELAKKKNELESAQRTEANADERERKKEESKTDKLNKRDQHEVNALQRIGGFLGTYSAAPELAALEVHRKNEGHLSKISKYTAKLAGQASTTTADDVLF